MMIDLHPDDRKVRQFSVAARIMLLAWAVKMALHSQGAWAWLAAGAGVAVATAGTGTPRVARPLYVAASFLTFPIGWAISHIVLALLYYVVVTPIGLVLRIGGRDRLRLTRVAKCETYWIERDKEEPPAEQYLRQF